MIRRILVLAAVLALVHVGVASASPVSVPFTEWNNKSVSLTNAGGAAWGGDGVTLSWVITQNLSTAVFKYTYTWSDAVTNWVLEASPDKTDVSFAWGSGYTATLSAPTNVAKIVGSVNLTNAITFDPNPVGAGGTGKVFSFYTFLSPVYGDAWGTNAADLAYNIGLGTDPLDANPNLKMNWVPIPDTGWPGGDIVIPEPGMSVLALGALVAGAFARWRRRKED